VAAGKEMSRKDKWAVMAFKAYVHMRARKQHGISYLLSSLTISILRSLNKHIK
jgi:hypothetical protein